jgi:predicted membrane channel-forming protein YqfA (hemolysin III family)
MAMKEILIKTAALLAAIPGIMAMITGSRVLTGNLVQDYHVIHWLVVYNVLLGFFSVAAGWFIWKKNGRASTLSIVIALSHGVVLLLLLTIYADTVAVQSIGAMTFRLLIWSVIALIVTSARQSFAAR